MRVSVLVVAVMAIMVLVTVSAKDQVELEPSAMENVSMLSMQETKIDSSVIPVPENMQGMWKDGVEYVNNIEGLEGQYEAQAIIHPSDASDSTFLEVDSQMKSESPSNPSFLAQNEKGKSEDRAEQAIEAQMDSKITAAAGGQQGLEQAGIWDMVKGAASSAGGALSSVASSAGGALSSVASSGALSSIGGHLASAAGAVGGALASGAGAIGGVLASAAGTLGSAVLNYHKPPPITPAQYAELANSADKFFDMYKRTQWKLNNLEGGLPQELGAQKAAQIEDCGGCLFMLEAVQMDVGSSRIQKTVFDSLVSNCRDGMTTPIFFPACELMLSNVDSICLDYVNGRKPEDICTAAGLCL